MVNLSSTRFYNWLTVLAILACAGFTALGQITSEQLGETMDSLFFSVDRSEDPGYSIAIVQNDSVIYQRSLGQINVEKEIPFTENSVFAIASCTKQFTAFGILLLEEEGLLKLEDDIRTYIPELPDFGATIQLKHLLSHTSGIRDHLTLLDWENKQMARDYTFQGTIRNLQHYSGLCFQPGENFAYSNTGYTLLAMVIERVSRKTINEFMHERIFDPLEMNDTEFTYKRDYQGIGYSRPYNYNAEKEKFIAYRMKEVNALGAVGIYTTINDFIKWDQNFRSMNVGNAAIFEEFLESDTLNNGLTINYNHGLKERYVKGYHVVEHSGGWAYYNFQYTQIPELGLSVIIDSNNELDYPIGMAETFIHSILPNDRMPSDSLEKMETTTVRPGDYISDNFTLRKIYNDGKQTRIDGKHMYGAKSYPLYQLPNGMHIDSVGNELITPINFSNFRWSGGGYFNVPIEFHPLMMITYPYDTLEGKYENPELGTIRIRYVRKNKAIKLKASFGKNPKIEKTIGQFIDLSSVEYDLIIKNENTLIIGNSYVFNLVFTRK